MLCVGRRREQSSPALVLKSEALATDADDDRMVQDTVEHRHGEYAVAGEGGSSDASWLGQPAGAGI
jgi:hypothetical protein